MAVKVAINGFGRIGRLAFRQMFGAEGFDMTQHRANMRWLTKLRLERTPSQLTEKRSRSMLRLTLRTFRGERSALT